MRVRAYVPLISMLAVAASTASAQIPAGEWPTYGRDAGGTRFSPLAQVTRDNVKDLRLAWVYRTGDMLKDRSRFEATPLMIGGTLYLSTPLGTVIALDPARGHELWRFNPHVDLKGGYGDFANRGVSAWEDTRAVADAICKRRIYVGTVDARLIAVDAATGHLCADFGTDGQVDLTTDLLNAPNYKGEYEVTSPPAIIDDLVIVGSSVADNHRTDAPNGVIRAYDARTGKERWSWDPIPRKAGTPGYDSWRGAKAHQTGAANAWSIISADQQRDLVFIPIGSASPDFFGGERLGNNLYANSVVALRASTGQLVWHFQVVHHDLWDYDVPAQPVLFTWRNAGKSIPAVAVGTKMGHLFILDRSTGRPLVPVEERTVPQTDVSGEQTSPTQPFPPESYRLAQQGLTPADAYGATEADRASCRAEIASLRSEGIFTPPSLKGSIDYPGHIGGMNWSGMSIDEADQLLIAPITSMAMYVKLVPRDDVSTAESARPDAELGRQLGTPFAMQRNFVLSSGGIPCSPPPWGTLVAFDLSTGTLKWRVPLGYFPVPADSADSGAKQRNLRYFPGLAKAANERKLGSPILGGVLLTRGSLAFVAGTFDQTLRAIDVGTGRELWSMPLPAGAHATPMTYEVDGKQYVVICAGGHDKLGTGPGDYVMAFALPDRSAQSDGSHAPQ